MRDSISNFPVYMQHEEVQDYSPSSPAVEEVYLAPEYICHFFLDSLSTDSSDFKSAG